MAFFRLMGSFLKSLLQLVLFLAQLGKRLFCWIGFLTCPLGGVEIGFHHPVFLVLAAIFCSVHSMCDLMFLAKLLRLLNMYFHVSLLCGSSTGLLGSGFVLVSSFLDCTWAFLGVHTCSIASREA